MSLIEQENRLKNINMLKVAYEDSLRSSCRDLENALILSIEQANVCLALYAEVAYEDSLRSSCRDLENALILSIEQANVCLALYAEVA